MTSLYNNYRVDTSSNGTTFTEITEVQEISISVGRRLSTGQWPTSSCTITARYPTGFNSPISGLGPGSFLRVWGPGRYPDGLPTWIGWVSDATPKWGTPWNSSTNRGEADQLTIEGEGHLGWIGRGTDYIASSTNQLAENVLNGVGQTFTNGSGSNAKTFADYARLTKTAATENPADVLQRISQSFDGKLLDGVCSSETLTTVIDKTRGATSFITTQGDVVVAPTKFSDTTNNATNRKYDQLQFGGLGDNYYSYGTVTSEAVGAVTRPSGAITWKQRELGYSTYNSESAYQAQLAQCLATQYGTRPTTPAPIMISALASVQQTDNLDSLGLTRDSDAVELALLCRAKIEIVFRGTTHYANIEGVTLTATPDDTRFTYYLTPRAYADWLILDDSTYGKLDTGRLAFA